jgi:hypothetical protein
MPTLYTVTYGGFTVYEGTDVEVAEDEGYVATAWDDEPHMDNDIKEE